MSNVTISIQDDLLKVSREYARTHRQSLNGLIRALLERTVGRSGKENSLKETFHLMDKTQADSLGKSWRREELYG